MLRSILVPLDGSAFSADALPPAAALAQRHGAALRLVAVYTPLVVPLPFADAPRYDTTFDDLQRQDLQRALEAYAGRLRTERGLEATVAVVDGDPAEVLADAAAGANVGLIAMTTHGRGGVARAWLGSVADELVRRTPVPLLLIRPDAATSDDDDRDLAAGAAVVAPVADPAALVLDRAAVGRYRRVLLPLDGSALAEEIIEPALEVGSPSDATYVLMRVVRVPYTIRPPGESYWMPREAAMIAAERERAATYLEGVGARVRAAGAMVEPIVVVHHDPARAILGEADARRVDLVALATHGRVGIDRLRLGSVVDKVVRAAPCPVLITRPAAGR